MVGVVADGDLEGLVGKPEIANADADVAYVIPNFRSCDIVLEAQSPLKARQSHVILGRVETTETHVVPELCGVDAALKEALVEPKSNLGLVGVEMVAGDARNRLHVVVVKCQHLLVEGEGLLGVVEHIVNPGDAYKHLGVK